VTELELVLRALQTLDLALRVIDRLRRRRTRKGSERSTNPE
jgi:hypothetical protein